MENSEGRHEIVVVVPTARVGGMKEAGQETVGKTGLLEMTIAAWVQMGPVVVGFRVGKATVISRVDSASVVMERAEVLRGLQRRRRGL